MLRASSTITRTFVISPRVSPAGTAIKAFRSSIKFPTAQLLSRRYSEAWGEEISQLQYPRVIQKGNKKIQQLLTSPTRFQPITEREDRSDIPISVYYDSICLGRFITLYREAMIIKNPQELSLYHQLFYHVRPRTVLELGTFSGASAVWFFDTASKLGIDCHVYSLDVDHTLIHENIKKTKPDNVTFVLGDCNKVEEAFPPSMLQTLPHPWLVIDDAHHNSINVLNYFNTFMKAGDYIVVEDTDPRAPSKIGLHVMFTAEECEPIGPEKLNMLKAFVREHGHDYLVDSFFTDFYAYNGTWHWHGFLRRMQ